MDGNGATRADYQNVIVIRYPSKECTEEEVLKLCSKYGPIDRSANLRATVDEVTGEAEVCVCYIRITDAEKAVHRLKCKGADVRWLSPRRTPTSPMKQQYRERCIVDLLRNIADRTPKEEQRADAEATTEKQQDVYISRLSSRKRPAEKESNLEVPEKMLAVASSSDATSGAATSSTTSLSLQRSLSSSALISKQASTASCQQSLTKTTSSLQATSRLSADQRLTSNGHRLPAASSLWHSHVTSASVTPLASRSAYRQSPNVSAADKWSMQSVRAGLDSDVITLPVSAAQPWRSVQDVSGPVGTVWVPQAPKLLPVSMTSSELNGLSQVQLVPNLYSQFPSAAPSTVLVPCVPAPQVQPWGAPVFLVANEPPYGVSVPQVNHAGLAPTVVLAPVSQLPSAPLFNPQQMFHAPASRAAQPVFVPVGPSFDSHVGVHHQSVESAARSLDVLDMPAVPPTAAKCRDIEALYASTLEGGSSSQQSNSAARKSLPLSKMKAIESKMDAFLESDDGWTERILDSKRMFETYASAVPSL